MQPIEITGEEGAEWGEKIKEPHKAAAKGLASVQSKEAQ